MNEAFETFLSLCTHPEIGGATREVRPIVVVEPAAERVAWTNAAGARLCNNATAWELVTTPSRRAATLARDLARHVKLRGAQERTTLVRVRVGTEMLVLQCLVRGVSGDQLREPVAFALVASPARFALRSHDPLAAFARFVGGANAAVVDANGTIVAGPDSDWYPRQLGTRSVALGETGFFLRLARQPEAAPDMPETSAPIRPPLDAVHLSPCRHVAPADLGAKAVPPTVEAAPSPAPVDAVADGGDFVADETPSPWDDDGVFDAPDEAEDETVAPFEAAIAEPGESARPIRFTWQTDGDDRLTYLSPEFSTVFGSSEEILGRAWRELSTAYGLDPEGAFADALSERTAWSGTTIYWPSPRHGGRVPIDLAGLAIESRDRIFSGFRGFGLIRAGDTVVEEAQASAPAAPADSHLTLVRTPAADPAGAPASPPDRHANVVHLPHRELERTDNRHLSRPERDAFRMIAAALGARFEGDDDGPPSFIDVAAPSVPAPQPAPVRARPRPAPRRPAEPEAVAMPSAFASAGREPDTRILDRLPVALIVSRDQRVAHANKAALKLLGYRSHEALERAGGLTAVFADVVDGEGGNDNAIHLSHADGRIMPAEVRLHTVPWGDGRALLIILRAEEPGGKRAREHHAMSDETDAGDGRTRKDDGSANPVADPAGAGSPHLSGVLDAIPDAVFVLDPDRRIVLANSGAEAIFRRPAATFRGMLLEHLLSEDDAGATRALFEDLSAGHGTQQPLVIDEVIGLCRGRGQVPLALSLGRVGNGPRVCAVLRDVGRWKSAEARFSAATEAAETANAQKSEMLARISHEIRTPLNAILGFADVMLAEKLGPLGNDRYRDYLRDISISGHHILSLVNDLLDLSKIEAGKLDLSFEPVSANDIARDCANIMEPQAHTDRVAIRTRLQSDLPRILADSRALRQITLNLLSNAIKFNRAGGEVSLSTFRDESGAVVLRVSDTGVGMSPDDLEAAMEPFRRVGSTNKSGTGLGLPLTKALAEANRADFAIRSEPGGGTVVDIIFPAPRVLAA
ncbi:signal transduction histidine kinase [Amorphus sp. MBR-141]